MQLQIFCQKIVRNSVREFRDRDRHDTYITLILIESTLSYITKCSIEHKRARSVYV